MFMLFYALVYYAEDPTALGLGLGLTTIATGLTIAPATLGMLAAGPGFGRTVIRYGPKPAVIIGAGVAILGTLLFLFNRATRIDVAVDAAVTMIGVVGMIIPIVNMISISIPDDSVATGLGMNTMLRNVGGALGAVIGTTILSTYTTSLTVSPGATVGFPNSTAFDYVLYVGMGFLIFAILISLAAKNYTFKGSRMQGEPRSSPESESASSDAKPPG